MSGIGIMQGRLSPAPVGRPQAFPWTTWHEEFVHAAACGFTHLEWLVTAERFDENPLLTGQGVDSIRRLIDETGIRVASVCADCFIPQPFVRVTNAERQTAVDRLNLLAERTAALGAGVLLVPVLENGAIREPAEGDAVMAALAPVAAKAEQLGIRIALEADLPAPQLRDLLDHQGGTLGAYYDVGNAVSAGFDPVEELRILGHRVCGVHIKDRLRHGASVALGEGDADFPSFFDALSAIGYQGPLILETPAGLDPPAAARRHRLFVEQHFGQVHGAPR